MQKKVDSIRRMLFLDDHHKMERFCLLFVIFVVILGSLFGICFKTYKDMQKLNLTTTALYTQSAQFSLTKDNIQFINLYRNEDYTKALVLLNVRSGMSNLSLDPYDYQILATGYEGKLTCNPRCGIYMFGDTGYVGIYFADAAGFDSALYNMVLRNYKMIGEHSDPNAATIYGDASYSTYNQAGFFVNLHGEDGVVVDFLNNDQAVPVAEDIYKEIIASTDYNELTANIDSSLSAMNTSMAHINEYMIRLTSYGIAIPELPSTIAGDQIVTDETLTVDNKFAFDSSVMGSDILSSSSSYDSKDSAFGCVAAVSGTDKLYLVTDYVYPGGVQFNHQNMKVTDKFLSKFCAPEVTYKDFSTQKRLESQSVNVKYTAPEKWYYTDGHEFIYDEEFSGLDDKAIYDTIQAYNNEVQNLCALKEKYQTVQLMALFKNEANSDSIASLAKFHSAEDTIVLY